MTYNARLISGGKVVIPAELRRKLGLSAGDVLVFEEDDAGQVVLKPYRQVVREIQDQMSKYKRPGASAVEELLAERRWEAAKEEEESRGYERRAGGSDE